MDAYFHNPSQMAVLRPSSTKILGSHFTRGTLLRKESFRRSVGSRIIICKSFIALSLISRGGSQSLDSPLRKFSWLVSLSISWFLESIPMNIAESRELIVTCLPGKSHATGALLQLHATPGGRGGLQGAMSVSTKTDTDTISDRYNI